MRLSAGRFSGKGNVSENETQGDGKTENPP